MPLNISSNSNQKSLTPPPRNDNDAKLPVKGSLQTAAGGYLGYKALTSGARRALGIRIEEHTTNLKNAKNIIKEGCILNPAYSGSGAAGVSARFSNNSKGYVHITGLSKDTMDIMKKDFADMGAGLSDSTSRKIDKVFDSPLKNVVGAIYRKYQKITYRCFSQPEVNKFVNSFTDMSPNAPEVKFTPKMIISNILNAVTGYKSKTFYIPGNEEFFKKNFIADVDDLALKTDVPLKVCKTKIGAIVKGLREFGLSGIKQNKTRALAGVAIFGALGFASYKLIKSGLSKLGITKDK